MADADISDRRRGAQRLPRLLLFDIGLYVRQPRNGRHGRFRCVRRSGACAGHEGDSGLGRQPHRTRCAVDRAEACRLVRARRERFAARAVGLDRYGQARLLQPRRVARADRRHALLGRALRRRRFPLRHGHARAYRVLAAGLGRAASPQIGSVHAGRGRGGQPLRGRCVRCELPVGHTSSYVRRCEGHAPRVGPARCDICRYGAVSGRGHAHELYLQPRRKLVVGFRV